MSQATCLNQTRESNLQGMLSPTGVGCVESDSDAELLINIPFRQPIKLHSIHFLCKDIGETWLGTSDLL